MAKRKSPLLSDENIRAISNNFDVWRRNQALKDAYWNANIGKLKLEAADKLWLDLVEERDAGQAAASAAARLANTTSSNTPATIHGNPLGSTSAVPASASTSNSTAGAQNTNQQAALTPSSLAAPANSNLGSRTSSPAVSSRTAPSAGTQNTAQSTSTATQSTSVPAPSAVPTSAMSALSLANETATTAASDPSVQAVALKYENEHVPMIGRQNPPGVSDLTKSPNTIQKRSDTDQKLAALRNLNLRFHARQGFVKATSHVYTNHFQIKIQKDVKLYKYKLESTLLGKNKRSARALMKTAMESYSFLSTNTANYATDHFDTIISWVPLQPQEAGYLLLNGDGHAPGSQWRLPDLQDGGPAFQVSLLFEGLVDVKSLIDHTNIAPGSHQVDMEPTKRVLNILIAKCFTKATNNMVQTGANKFFLKSGRQPLSGRLGHSAHQDSVSLCTMRGYYYTIKPGIREVLLNINSGVSAFYMPVLVSKLMNDKLTFSPHELESVLKGVRVHIQYERGDPKDTALWDRLNSPQARVKTIQGLGQALEEEEWFDAANNRHGVLDHLMSTYNKTYQYPKLRAVNLGSTQDPKWYAPEDLEIIPYQIFTSVVPASLAESMLRVACLQPYEAAALVEVEALDALGIPRTQQNPIPLPNCPILTIDPRMIQVPSSRFGFPRLQYGKKETPLAEDHWNTKGKSFFKCRQMTFNVLVLVDGNMPDRDETAGAIQASFEGFCGPSRRGYSVATVNDGNRKPHILKDPKLTGQIRTGIDSARQKHGDINFLLLVLGKKDTEAYARFKDLADRTYGYHSICVVAAHVARVSPDKMGNIMLKANLKARGINHTINGGVLSNIMADTLVLGADVTHPNSSSIQGCPSVAAIVGSVDAHAGRFLGSMRLNKNKQEMIDKVFDMVVERIKDWIIERYAETRKVSVPKNIIYYRDGVSEAQYHMIKYEELPHIRSAWPIALEQLRKDMKYPHFRNIEGDAPKLTAIVCAKRHHVRFYPKSAAPKDMAKNKNCPSGTYVDDVVTSPYYADFYLQSHAPIQGTARPAHYFILVNEMNRTVDELRQLTHELCFTYVRATSGVSYASPAYYADRLCERGRCYLRDFFVNVNAREGRDLRDQFKMYRNKLENKQANARVAAYGSRWLPSGDRRQKGIQEEIKETEDKKELEQECLDWTMRQAENVVGKDRNPWHDGVSKTMFWM